MPGKRVSFGTTPIPKAPLPATAEQWVESRSEEAMKRLTIDIPESLHRRIKADCARRGVKMANEIRELLETHFRE